MASEGCNLRIAGGQQFCAWESCDGDVGVAVPTYGLFVVDESRRHHLGACYGAGFCASVRPRAGGFSILFSAFGSIAGRKKRGWIPSVCHAWAQPLGFCLVRKREIAVLASRGEKVAA